MSQIIRSTQKLIVVFIIMDLVQFALVPHYVDLVDQLSLMFPHGFQHTEPLSRPNFLRRSFCFFCGASPASKLFPCSVIPLPPCRRPPADPAEIVLSPAFSQRWNKKGGKHIGPCILASSNWNDLGTQSCYKVSESTCN